MCFFSFFSFLLIIMGNLVFGSAETPGNSTDAAEIPVVRDNDVAIGQGARPTERPEKATAAARHRSNVEIAVTPPRIARLRSNLVQSFDHVTGDTLQMFKVKGQKSRSHSEISRSRRKVNCAIIRHWIGSATSNLA